MIATTHIAAAMIFVNVHPQSWTLHAILPTNRTAWLIDARNTQTQTTQATVQAR